MKIRSGFVSNSSSTSFLIFGVIMEIPDIEEKVEEYSKVDLKTKIYYNENMTQRQKQMMDDTLDNYELDSMEIVEEILFPDMEVIVPPDGDIAYIGKSPVSMRDDETMGEFKDKVRNRLKYHNIEEECGWHEDCWFDG